MSMMIGDKVPTSLMMIGDKALTHEPMRIKSTYILINEFF